MKHPHIKIESTLTDQTILKAIQELEDYDQISNTPYKSLKGLVASHILHSNIPDGASILHPIYLLIRRNLINTLSNKNDMDDGTLFFLKKQADISTTAEAQKKYAIQLGDRAIHLAAGYRPNKINKVMSECEIKNYTKSMTHYGYSLAINSRKNKQQKHNLESMLSPILKKFDTVSTILNNIQNQASYTISPN